MAVQAVIFDLDGTVLDNEAEWEEAFCTVAKKFIISSSKFLMPNGWQHEPGIGLANNWRRITGKVPIEKLVSETVETYRNLSRELKLREGIKEVIEKIKSRGWRTALSTSSTWSVVEKELEELGLELAFDITTTGEEVLVPKPDPEIYLLTAQKLETDPENCLVVEDAIAGIRAAKEAGCRVAGFISEYAVKTTLEAAGADYTIDNIAVLSALIDKIG